jgi:uncharacterized protein
MAAAMIDSRRSVMNAQCQGMVFAIALLTLAAPADAQYALAGGANAISVNGEAEIRVVPDEVLLSLGVETFDKVLKSAKSLNDDRIKKTIASARGFGVLAEHIQTDYIGIEPRYHNSDISRELLGYVVRKTVLIRLKDISKFEDLLSAALEAGVTHVHGIDFRTTELRKHRDQARVLALKAAQEKAELLARESGRRVGKAMSIGEASYGYHSSYGSWWGGRYGSTAQNVVQSFGGAALERDGTLAPGQISIRVNVGASFSLD